MFRSSVLPVCLAGVWVAASEFFRNEVLVKHLWTDHYTSLGLAFPSEPVNGAVWVAWSFLLAVCIKVILHRFSLIETVALAWAMGFVLMWLVIGNMAVLPFGILIYAVPLSLLEVVIAALILDRTGTGR